MKNKFKPLLKILFFFWFTGATYYMLEILYRGHSDISMFILGGICGLFVMGLNNIFTYDMDYLLQCFLCVCFITLGELVVGLTFNGNHEIWDYTDMFLNFKGQICLSFSFLWMILSAIFIPILDYIDWKLFDYKKDTPPYYKIFGKMIVRLK